MSSQNRTSRLTSLDIRARKGGEPLVALTAYTAPMAGIVDEVADIALVGDSLGMVVYGLGSTVPVTLEMDIHLFRPIANVERIDMRGRLAKSGRSVMIFEMDFHDAQGAHLGFGHSMFMAAPDPNLSLPPGDWAIKRFDRLRATPLQQPLAQRVNCEVQAPGVAVLPRARDILNTARAINGGLLTVP